MRVVEWNKILLLESCGGYYDNYPCKAHTCNLEQDTSDVVSHFKDNNIDISTILCFDVIEHLFNPAHVLER